VGTPAYLPPEALGGTYDRRSEIYSLGVSWHEILKGRKLPPYFLEVLERMTAKDPNERPASALSLIKYLNRHVPRPFPISPEEDEAAVFDKPPWVERDEEKAFWNAVEDADRRGGSSLIVVTGPTGAGRTRFLEELRWKFLLRGKSLTCFPDLHEAPASRLAEIQLSLRRLSRGTAPSLSVLEYDQDLVAPELQALVDYAGTWPGTRTIALKDLTEAQTRRLIRNALLDRAPEKMEEDRIVRFCGGRPLLVLDYLRHRGESRFPPIFRKRPAPETERLSAPARRLLALIVAHPEPPETTWMENWGSPPTIWPTPASSSSPPASWKRRLRREPSSLTPSLTEDRLSERAGGGNALGMSRALDRGPDARVRQRRAVLKAALIAEHALEAGSSPTARRYGLSSVEHYSRSGQWARVTDLCVRLAAIAETPMDRAVVHAYEAPVFFRLGPLRRRTARLRSMVRQQPDDGTDRGDGETPPSDGTHIDRGRSK
jgi:serine/threonine protein kinase